MENDAHQWISFMNGYLNSGKWMAFVINYWNWCLVNYDLISMNNELS
jgi:hypothetical protein